MERGIDRYINIVGNFVIAVWRDDFFVSTRHIKVSAVISSVRPLVNVSLAKQSLLGAYISEKLPILLERST